ncbi:MAG: glycosyltransferase [Deltaproteobacteria bacterium]|nr:glycosyltransferase [Deltaproteobacteria bacterium]
MSRRLKIVFMIDSLDGNGGTENQLLKMLIGINRSQFDVHLVCFRHTPWFVKNAHKIGCPSTVLEINSLRNWHTYRDYCALVRLLRKLRPDVVHTFFPMANIVGVFAARLAGVKNVISSRRDFGEWMNSRYLIATRAANLAVSRIVANSEMVKTLTVEKEKAAPSKIEVFYNGIDIDLFSSLKPDISLKKSLGIPAADKVIGIIANFRPMKHHHIFLKAAAEALSKRSDLSFLLIGIGPLKDEMIALAKTLGVGHKTHFAGHQTDIRPYLSIIDVGVNCSEGEGLSNAVMEYMCSRIPCVVSEAGGNINLVTNNKNGYTFALDDHSALAASILELLDNESTRKRFTESAFQFVKERMSLEAMLSSYETLYRSMADA